MATINSAFENATSGDKIKPEKDRIRIEKHGRPLVTRQIKDKKEKSFSDVDLRNEFYRYVMLLYKF